MPGPKIAIKEERVITNLNYFLPHITGLEMTQPIDVVLLHLDGKIVTSYSCDELNFLEPIPESIEERRVIEAIRQDDIMQRQPEPLKVRGIASKIHMLAIPKELLGNVSSTSSLGRLLIDSAKHSRIVGGQPCYEVAVSIDPEAKSIIYSVVRAEFLEQTKRLEKQNERLILKASLAEASRKRAEDLLTANLAKERQFMCLPLWRKIWQLITKSGPYG